MLLYQNFKVMIQSISGYGVLTLYFTDPISIPSNFDIKSLNSSHIKMKHIPGNWTEKRLNFTWQARAF